MSGVDASELGLDLNTKPKKKSTKKSSKEAVDEAELGLDLKKKPTKKTTKKKSKDVEEVDEQELEQIEQQAASLFSVNAQKKKAKTSFDDSHLEELDEDELDEINMLIDGLRETKDSKGVADQDFNELEDFEGGEATWLDSERDYHYAELLDRISDILRKKNPDLIDRSKRIRMKIPQVAKDGPKKTIFINFAEICTNLHRQQEHVLAYLLAELGSSGTQDSNSRLTIRGSFKGKDIETVLRKYITEYVACRVCGSLDTILSRDANTRLYSLNCMSCGASRTVSAVNKGYVANITRRRRAA